MAVLKDYRCQEPTCGRLFDSFVPVCIHCGSTNVKTVYLQAPGFKSDKTKAADDHMDHHLKSFGMTDFNNNPSTSHTPTADFSRWRDPREAIGEVKGVGSFHEVLRDAPPIQTTVNDGAHEFSGKVGGSEHYGAIDKMAKAGGVNQRGPAE